MITWLTSRHITNTWQNTKLSWRDWASSRSRRPQDTYSLSAEVQTLSFISTAGAARKVWTLSPLWIWRLTVFRTRISDRADREDRWLSGSKARVAEGLFTMRNPIIGARRTKWGVFTPKQGQYLAF